MAAKVTSVFRPLLLAGKSAIVTGGGTGIGKAITQELLYLGCSVMIASRNGKRLSESYEKLRLDLSNMNSPAKLEMMECNIRKEEQVQKLVSESIARFGGIDFMVNNAGGQFPSPAENISTKGFMAVIETNLTGTFICCREVYNQYMQEHGGVIINIIADMWKGFPLMSHTGAARSGVDNLTKSLSLEWAASGVRVNAVAPGSSIYSDTANANYDKSMSSNIFAAQIPNLPTKRLGTVEEVSASVVFLLSPAAAFISGETLRVDGAHSLYAPTVPFNVPDHDRQPAYTWENDVKTQQTQGTTPKNKSKL